MTTKVPVNTFHSPVKSLTKQSTPLVLGQSLKNAVLSLFGIVQMAVLPLGIYPTSLLGASTTGVTGLFVVAV